MTKLIAFLTEFINYPFINGSIALFSGTMIANVMAYVYHLVIGRVLGPVGYGEIASLFSIFNILVSPSSVLQNILVKFFTQLKAKRDYGQVKRLFMRITKLLLVIEVVLFFLLFPFASMVAKQMSVSDYRNLIWLYLIFATYVLSVINISVIQSFQQFVTMTAISTLGSIFRLSFGLVGAVFGVTTALIGNVAASAITYFITLVPLRKLMEEKESQITISPMSAVYYSIPTLIATFAITAIYSQDVILIKRYLSPEDSGIYASLSALGKIVFFASSFFGLVAFPMVAERKEMNRPFGNIIALALIFVAVISFGITSIYFLFPKLVVRMLFGETFISASMYLGYFGLFMSFYTLSNTLTTLYLALGKTRVWVFALMASIAQAMLIVINHSSISVVLQINIMVSAVLFGSLMLYYPFSIRSK